MIRPYRLIVPAGSATNHSTPPDPAGIVPLAGMSPGDIDPTHWKPYGGNHEELGLTTIYVPNPIFVRFCLAKPAFDRYIPSVTWFVMDSGQPEGMGVAPLVGVGFKPALA
jgi:hypothetical protein